MKIIAILIFYWGLCLGLYAQTDTARLNRTDDKGLKQGLWIKLDENGKKKYDGYFKNNIPVGEFTYYEPSGKVAYKSTYFNNGKSVCVKDFYESGSIMSIGYYLNKQKDSVWKYYSEDSILLKQESYKNDKKHGVWLLYSHDTIVESQTWRFGQLNGSYFVKTNRYTITQNYQQGLADGAYKEVWNNGKVKASGKYIKGKRNETWSYYHNSGIPSKIEKWKDGNLIERLIYIPTQEKISSIAAKNIAYFYGTTANTTIVMLKSGEKINARMDYMDLFDLLDQFEFLQINKNGRFITRLTSVTDFIQEGKIYQLKFKPDCGIEVRTDEEGAKAINSMLPRH